MVKKVVKKKISNKESKAEESPQVNPPTGDLPVKKKRCYFCQQKSIPIFTDVVTLRRFLTDRAKILPKIRSGLCSKHQRFLTRQIKYARHLALLPFTPNV
ncbi:30S ribosomal protein S18 [Candidatus Microgenomates bacterium]|nr:30S ribosomal protein S18 [Candidatus Microgenomates bacterium]